MTTMTLSCSGSGSPKIQGTKIFSTSNFQITARLVGLVALTVVVAMAMARSYHLTGIRTGAFAEPYASRRTAEPNASSRTALVAFVAVGNNEERHNIMLRNIDTHFSDRTSFTCLVFAYANHSVLEAFAKRACNVHYERGRYWEEFVQMITPDMTSRVEYVMVFMDDVSLSASFNAAAFFSTMRQNSLQVASPRVTGSVWRVLDSKPDRRKGKPEKGICIRLTQFIEIQAIAVTRDVWSCWLEAMRAQNIGIPGGQPAWFDFWLYPYCSRKFNMELRMGVVNHMEAVHERLGKSSWKGHPINEPSWKKVHSNVAYETQHWEGEPLCNNRTCGSWQSHGTWEGFVTSHKDYNFKLDKDKPTGYIKCGAR